jgi:Carboxypeptidase regulatory-like domain/TonB dependent receptor
MKSLFSKTVFVFAMLLCASLGYSQDLDDVTISGKITDSNKLPITGATVTATLTTTGATRTVQSDDEGRYRMLELKPGIYLIKATMQGFGAKSRKDLTTVSGQNVQLNFELSPGDVSAETTVTAGDDEQTTTVDTTRTIVGGTITAREIEEIPNNTRNALDLVLTLGGTSEEALSTRDLAEDRNATNRLAPAEQGNFSLSGGSSYSNNLTIDGLDNNDDRSANNRFTPSLEAVAEVQVVTNQFSAEYGRASGGRINLRTKAGANNFRGRVFGFMRNDNWNANTYYNNQTFYKVDDSFSFSRTGTTNTITNLNTLATNILREPLGRLDFVEYSPGFIFSGPVILPFGEGKSIYDGRNRTFFSVAYEYNNLQDTSLIDTYVPIGTNTRFKLPSPTSTEVFCENNTATIPATNSTCANGGAANISRYQQFIKTPNLNHTLTARIDHTLFKNNDVTFGWQLGRKRNQRQNVASTTKLEEALQGTSGNTDAFNFTDNHVFGAKAVNQFRMQWSRYLPGFESNNPEATVVLIGYLDPLVISSTGSGKTLIAGNSTASASNGLFASQRKERRLQFQDSLTYILGSHTFKGGFDFQRVNSFNLDQSDATGTYNFANSSTTTSASSTGYVNPSGILYSAVQNYLLNQPTRYRQNFDTSSTIKNTYWSLFLNDDFKLNNNLTLSLGVRYEKEKILADNNNFGPRIGIAWKPFENNKTVIRFGAGIFYNRVLLRSIDDFIITGQQNSFDSNNVANGVGNSLRRQVLTSLSGNFPNKYKSAQELKTYLLSQGFPVGTGFTTGNDNFTRLVNTATLKIPESYQFNLGFEREIGKGLIFEANYTWNKTVHLWGESNPNAPSLKIANSTLGTNFQSWADYLQSINTGNIRFVLGSNTDNIGTSSTITGAGCSTVTPCIVVNLNTINPSQGSTGPLGIALQAINRFRPSQNDASMTNDLVVQQELLASDRKSYYHGLILELRSRYRKLGLGFGGNLRIAYTLSSLKDDGVNNTSDAEINGDFGREWSRGLQDRRHRLAVSGSFDSPKWLGKLKFSPLFRFGSSAPFNLSYGGVDRNLDDVSNDRVNFSGNIKDIKWREQGSAVPTALLSQFSLQPIGGSGGNLPRNAGNGPVFWTLDMQISREWKLSERMKFRPTVELGNLLNATVLSFGSGFVDYNTFGVQTNPTLTCNPSTSTACLPPNGTTIYRQNNKETFERNEFLIPTRALRPREIRVGFRFDF